jgi:hypothetical protein
MMMSEMKKHLSLVMAVCTVAILANTHHIHAQVDNTQIRIAQLKAIFQQFKNYRYSPNLIWELPDNRLKAVDKSNSSAAAGAITPDVQAFIANFQATADRINFFAQQGLDAGSIRARIEGEDPTVAGEAGFNETISYYVNQQNIGAQIVRKGYVVTTRNQSTDEDVPSYGIIALITTNESLTQRIPDNLAGVSPNEIRTFVRELDELVDSSANNPITIREYLAQALMQGDLTNVTLEAQGIGDERTQFAPRVYGNTIGVAEDNLAQYMRITEGQPMDYQYPNEVTVSLFDLVRYRRYGVPEDPNAPPVTTFDRYDPVTDQTYTIDIVTNEVLDSIQGNTVVPIEPTTTVYNRNLPLYGVEVRYGLEEINYPSLWSERLAVNALWGSSRIGVILPTRGWAGLSEAFGQTRKLTSAGWGFNGALDFPIKIISQSGVFNFAGGYVFDEASSTDHQTFYERVNGLADFLVRYDAQAHYSFAVNIDRDHFFRFKLGGTVYGMESWTDRTDSSAQIDPNTGELPLVFTKASTETIGGISGRIEYMATNNATPYGAGLQYFDEAIMADVWLQVPISRSFAFRIDAKGFAPILRDPRVWENKTIFIPTVRAIYNF